MDEQSLIKEALAGNENAWDELVKTYMKSAYYYSLKLTSGNAHEAEELSQDAFVQVYKNLKWFRSEAPFKNWLYKIITNLFINLRKRSARMKSLDSLKQEPVGITGPDFSGGAQSVLSGEFQSLVKDKMDSLPARQKAVLALFTYEGLSLEEISRTLDISYASVKMNLSLARKRMREELKEYLK